MVEKRLLELKDKKNFKRFYEKNLKLTKKDIAAAVGDDQLIMQTISSISELDRISNVMSKRFREWYALYWPELVNATEKHEALIEIALKRRKRDSEMGGDVSAVDVDQMLVLAAEIERIFALRFSQEKYLETIMKKYCPNLMSLAGVTIGAKLLEMAKGLKRLALLPASTIQLLGAEKALFRHLKTGSRSPKHGIIINHPLVQKVNKNKRGKMARMLADKLAICARLDYFKGKFMAEEYYSELEGKI